MDPAEVPSPAGGSEAPNAQLLSRSTARYTPTIRATVSYVALLVVAVFAFLVIRGVGEGLLAPEPARLTGPGATGTGTSAILSHLLLAMAAVVTVGRLLGWLFRRVGQPPVIGEVVGGILLGPSILGLISPAAYHFILPPEVAPFLGVVAQLGVILYMFLVGLELNPESLRNRVQAVAAISHASIVLPFVLGSALALFLYPRFATQDVPFTAFALFMGLAMSITAFPVLARILSDRGMSRSELGAMALTCAAVGDVTAWCLLAFVVGVVHSTGNGAIMVAALTIGFIAAMFFIVGPLTARLVKTYESHPSQGLIALTLVAVIASALTTEAIGIHAIFGAFLFGVVIPHDSALARSLKQSLENVVTILLLPAFFAFTGMRTELGLVSGAYEWLVCALIIAVATVGKFGGTLLAARLTGLGWHRAAALGVLMNTRGLMELVVLSVGLELGVISPKLFAMMVLMAIATTVATTPILDRLTRGRAEIWAPPR